MTDLTTYRSSAPELVEGSLSKANLLIFKSFNLEIFSSFIRLFAIVRKKYVSFSWQVLGFLGRPHLPLHVAVFFLRAAAAIRARANVTKNS
ncbi:hypothetical protein CHX27_05570 [Flavobacterium aurantiibacter]|uniref:Uncharacterized protein n=1 Tax=Flavobacterium aurantiibacter TaxID=2023067 RepID=A0A255ZW58_9FLAO|nr:hypothetical protein CHX27_05570 [Flavobacterium aurantiibacter]